MMMIRMHQTNVLIFPIINVTLVQLADYWRDKGFALANTKHGNLCLIEISNSEQEDEYICTGQEPDNSGTVAS